MAIGKGINPNGKNSLGGRKPAIPAIGSVPPIGGSPSAGAVANSTRNNPVAKEPSPTVPPGFGTHIGASTHQGNLPKRRTISTDAR